jgi:hypothetical protein
MNAVIYEYSDGTLQVEDADNGFVHAIALDDPECPGTYVILDPCLAASELAEAWGDPALPEWLEGGPDLGPVITSLHDNGYDCYRGWVTPEGEIVVPADLR